MVHIFHHLDIQEKNPFDIQSFYDNLFTCPVNDINNYFEGKL